MSEFNTLSDAARWVVGGISIAIRYENEPSLCEEGTGSTLSPWPLVKGHSGRDSLHGLSFIIPHLTQRY